MGAVPSSAGRAPLPAADRAESEESSARVSPPSASPPSLAKESAASTVPAPLPPPLAPQGEANDAKGPASEASAPRSPATALDSKNAAATPLPGAAAPNPEPAAQPAAAKQDPAKQDPAKQDAAKLAAFTRAVAGARAAMAQRDLAASKQKLETAAANAQGAADQAELERLQMLQDHLEQFWDGIHKAVAAMQPVDEIVLSESNRVAVIEANGQTLSVQWEGRPRRWRIEAIPMSLLSAIAKSSFRQTPGSKLIVGSFLAMDSLGDRTEAAKLWREAIRNGESEGKLLLPELKVPRAAGSAAGTVEGGLGIGVQTGTTQTYSVYPVRPQAIRLSPTAARIAEIRKLAPTPAC